MTLCMIHDHPEPVCAVCCYTDNGYCPCECHDREAGTNPRAPTRCPGSGSVWGVTRFDPALRSGIVVIELFATKELAEAFRAKATQRYTVTRFHIWDELPDGEQELFGSPVTDHPLGFLTD